MNDRDAEILLALRGGARLMLDRGEIVGVEADWLRPLDIGGRNNSHHSSTLRRLMANGWVERRSRREVEGLRPSHVYRITMEGVMALANHGVTLSRTPMHAA
jgi:hypothetical protein